MKLFQAAVWILFDATVFKKPCAFIRGHKFISQPFFSKTFGRLVIAIVHKTFSLSDDETEVLHASLESSDLPDAPAPYDLVLMNLNSNTNVLDRMAQRYKGNRGRIDDSMVAEMYRPLGAYFDAYEVLQTKESVPPPEVPRTKGGYPIS